MTVNAGMKHRTGHIKDFAHDVVLAIMVFAVIGFIVNISHAFPHACAIGRRSAGN